MIKTEREEEGGGREGKKKYFVLMIQKNIGP